jgi:hypothetical protein
MATKKNQASVIMGLVVLRSKTADSEKETIALSIASQDAQDIDLEILVMDKDDELKVDQLYNAIITKGKGEGLNFKVTFLNEVDHGHYDERMVIKGDISGHLNLNILPEQDQFFFEGKEYSIVFEEVTEEEEEEEVVTKVAVKKPVKKPVKKVAVKKEAKVGSLAVAESVITPLTEGEVKA